MKKVAIGCLGALGFIAVVIVAVVIINSVFMPKDNDTTPTGLATMTTTTLAAVAVELSAAEDEGLIGVSTFGSGYKNKVHVSLTSYSDDELRVSILPGTIFESQSASTISAMVVVNDMELTLQPHKTLGPVSVATCCTSLALQVPEMIPICWS
jgi:hypothetical protein